MCTINSSGFTNKYILVKRDNIKCWHRILLINFSRNCILSKTPKR